MLSKLKEEFNDSVVVFNGGGRAPLKDRKDLDKLAIIAHESNSPSLKKLFEVLPPLEELKKANVDEKVKDLKVDDLTANKSEAPSFNSGFPLDQNSQGKNVIAPDLKK